MKLRFFRTGLVVLSILLLSAFQASAMVVATNWGAETSASTFFAPSYYTDFDGNYDGGMGSVMASSTFSDHRGNAAAYAALGLAPQLKARAEHIAGTNGAWGQALAIEEFTYSGSSAATLQLDVSLTGSVLDPYSSNDVWVRAQVYAFKAENFYYSWDPGTLFYEMGATLMEGEPGAAGASELYLEFEGNTIDGSLTDSIVFDVDPGETFFVWARLLTSAVWNGTEADAYNTLDLSFTDTDNLTAGSVPVPGTFLLLFSGLVGLASIRRK